MRDESAVEPTRSENITVTWRRSAASCCVTGGATGGVGLGGPFSTPRSSAMACSSSRRCPSDATPSSFRSWSVRSRRMAIVMSFSAKHFAYCPRPSFSSQLAVCCVAALRCAALGTLLRFNFDALLDRALAGLPPAREGFFIASTHGLERGIVAGPESTGHGLQCFGVGVERRDILRRYTSAALR